MSFHYFISSNRELKIKNRSFFFILFCYLFIPAIAMAGSFKVSPVKIHIESKTKKNVIKITNNNDERVTVQLEVKEWSQIENEPDTYKPTKDIVFFPKIVTIEKGEEQIIRVGYQGDNNPATEKTYRLFLEELPVTESSEATLNFTLRVVVPIFIRPLNEVKEFSIEKVRFSEGKLAMKIKNSGNTHFIVGKITAIGFDNLDNEVFETGGNGWYVLAGAERIFDIEIPEEGCNKTKTIKLTMEVDRTLKKEELNLDKAQCVNKKENEKVLNGQLTK